MKPLKEFKAFLKVKDKDIQYTLLNPEVYSIKGLIYIDAYLDSNDFSSDIEILDRMRFNGGNGFITINELDTIIGYSGITEYELTYVKCIHVRLASYKVKFRCYGSLTKKADLKHLNDVPNELYSICTEGLVIDFDRGTQIEQIRILNGKEERRLIEGKLDIKEGSLYFSHERTTYQLNIAFIKSKKRTHIRFVGDQKIEYRAFKKIAPKFIAFLSFAGGNKLQIRSESYIEDKHLYKKRFSKKSIKPKCYSTYIPISTIDFRNSNVLQEYFFCFEKFLIADHYLNISDIIYLLNESQTLDISGSFFIKLIAIEKLADALLQSPFIETKDSNIVEAEEFENSIIPVKQAFEQSFAQTKSNNQKAYNTLYSKLGNINKKGKTDNKIDLLLDFAEIERTPKIERLFPLLRNMAIHQGKIDFPEGAAFENYQTLDLLVHDIIANIIQYRGIRFITTEGLQKSTYKKLEFKLDYSKYWEMLSLEMNPKALNS